eukprot:360592-Chlamydomonas_euryale.AAC.3
MVCQKFTPKHLDLRERGEPPPRAAPRWRLRGRSRRPPLAPPPANAAPRRSPPPARPSLPAASVVN